jgi:hypothetical protein
VREDGPVLARAAATATLPASPQPGVQQGLEVSPLLGLTVLALAIALFLLLRSMRHQLRKIDFDETALTDEERARRREPPQPRAPDG